MTQEEIDDIVLSRNLDLCVLAAKLGFGLDVFVNDDCDTVRSQVARQGYGLDKPRCSYDCGSSGLWFR